MNSSLALLPFVPPKRHVRRLAIPVVLASAALGLVLPAVTAQTQNEPKRDPVKVFHLANIGQTNEANEIMVALRNMLIPSDKIYLLTFSNDVVVEASPEEIARAGDLIAALDHPKKTYRLTYTLNESDSGRRVGVQHFSVVVVLGQRVALKQGDKLPVLTGSYETDKATQQTQFTYLDVGINIDSTLDTFADGLRLRSKVEQSSVAQLQPNPAAIGQDPVVRQTVLEGTSAITPGKPLTLGSVDIVGSTRHVDIEVIAEPLP